MAGTAVGWLQFWLILAGTFISVGDFVVLAAIIWLTMTIIVVVVTKSRVRGLELVVNLTLWASTLAMCGANQFDWWPDFRPLGWLTMLFEPATRWMMGEV